MKVIEAHKIIADAIGDNIDIDLNQTKIENPNEYVDEVIIPDGVRFSKYDREWYLYRGMVHTLYRRILVLKSIHYKDLSYQYALKYFPQSLKRRLFSIETEPTLGFSEDQLRRRVNPIIGTKRQSIAFILSARIKKYKKITNNNEITYEFIGYYPVPIRTMYQVNMLINNYVSQRPDYMIEVYSDINNVTIKNRIFQQEELRLELFNGYNEYYEKDKVEIQFIENITTPDKWYGYDELPIDSYLQQEALIKAIEYMMMDNQDIQLSPAMLQNEISIQNLLLRQE